MVRFQTFFLLVIIIQGFISSSLLNPSSVFALELAKSTWPTLQQNFKRHGLAKVSGPGVVATVKWRYTAPHNSIVTNTSNLGAPVVGVDGTIFTRDAVNPDGTQKWSGLDRYITGSTIADDGNIYSMTSGEVYGGGMYSVNASTGHINWFNRHGTVSNGIGLNYFPGWDENAPIIDSSGNLVAHGYFNSNAVNMRGEAQWQTLFTDAFNYSIMAQDDNGNLYLPLRDAGIISFTADGVIRWTKTLPPLVGGDEHSLIVSPDNSTIYYLDGTDKTFLAVSSTDGSTIWSVNLTQTYTEAPGNFNMALSPDKNTIYIVVSGPGPLVAINLKSRSLKWTFGKSPNVGFSGPFVVVDSNGIIYFDSIVNTANSIQALQDNGNSATALWSYPQYGNLAIGPNNRLYVAASTGATTDRELYAFSPWTMSLQVNIPDSSKASTITNFIPITFTVRSSMLQKDPDFKTDPTIANNQVQVRFKNGTVLPLSYEKIDGDDTIWSGTYRYPKTTGKNSELIGTVEASAYETTTTTATNFSTRPPGFDNTGIAVAFSLNTDNSGTYAIDSENPTGILQTASPSAQTVHNNEQKRNFLASIREFFLKLFGQKSTDETSTTNISAKKATPIPTKTPAAVIQQQNNAGQQPGGVAY